MTSPSSPSAASPTPLSADPFNYDAYAAILKQYVNAAGFVDYQGLQANAEALRTFNQSLGTVPPDRFATWTKADQMAFLINAYNAFTLQSIIDQTPIKASIKDIPGVWRRRQFQLAGASKTLDDIEHKTLRPVYQDPRVHAALNCTALSCPQLRTEPYQGQDLDNQLDDQVRRWLASPQGLQINRTNNQVSLSKIFDWFGDDWIAAYSPTDNATYPGGKKQQATLNFISRYISPADQTYLQQGSYEVKYLDYDWKLNSQP